MSNEELYDVTVWDVFTGDILQKLWEVSWPEVLEIEEQYQNEIGAQVEVEML